MELLTRTLYLLSTGLLVPVIVLLLILFGRSLLLVGRTYGAWLSRLRFRSALRPLLDRLDRGNVESVLRDADLPPEAHWTPAIGRLLDHGGSAAHREKVLADIEAMAENLQVAFSTTVVGLFVGGIGFAVQQAKQRWHTEALNDLEFVSGLVGERAPKPAEGGTGWPAGDGGVDSALRSTTTAETGAALSGRNARSG